jgi:hypothetical protein
MLRRERRVAPRARDYAAAAILRWQPTELVTGSSGSTRQRPAWPALAQPVRESAGSALTEPGPGPIGVPALLAYHVQTAFLIEPPTIEESSHG